VGKPEGKRPVERHRRREANIVTYISIVSNGSINVFPQREKLGKQPVAM
jgi:hypothetical protein